MDKYIHRERDVGNTRYLNLIPNILNIVSLKNKNLLILLI